MGPEAVITVNIDGRYGDGFGDIIPVHVCQEWMPRWTIKVRNGTNGGGGFISCENFDVAVREVQRLKENESKATQ
jgi:hypothetical protein